MTRIAARVAALATLAAAGGCGHGGATRTPAPVADAPCKAYVASRDLAGWKAVAADGFTFCVPPDWRVGRNSGIGNNASLSWGTGEQPHSVVREEVRTVKPSEFEAMVLANSQTDSRRFTENIGGRDANVWRSRSRDEYHTGAQWKTPRVWLVGKEQTADAADVDLTIIRTVRFPSA